MFSSSGVERARKKLIFSVPLNTAILYLPQPTLSYEEENIPSFRKAVVQKSKALDNILHTSHGYCISSWSQSYKVGEIIDMTTVS